MQRSNNTNTVQLILFALFAYSIDSFKRNLKVVRLPSFRRDKPESRSIKIGNVGSDESREAQEGLVVRR